MVTGRALVDSQPQGHSAYQELVNHCPSSLWMQYFTEIYLEGVSVDCLPMRSAVPACLTHFQGPDFMRVCGRFHGEIKKAK